jgi:hypothetical protein
MSPLHNLVWTVVGLLLTVELVKAVKFYITVQPNYITKQTGLRITASSAGSKVYVAVYPNVFKSSVWGNGWMQLSAAPTMTGKEVGAITTSESGQNIAMVDHYGVYISPMYGDYWLEVTPVTGVGASHLDWTFMAGSKTGFVLLAAATTGAAYYSHNGGYNWTSIKVPAITTGIIASVAVSNAQGTYMVITMDSPDGLVWISSNEGVSWSSVSSSTLPAGCYNNAVIDASGQYITLMKCGTKTLYQSSNFGATWGTTAPSLQWSSVATCPSGQYAIATSSYNSGTMSHVWISSANGYFWSLALTASASNVSYNAVAISQNGQVMMAGATNGWIKYSTNYGVTWSSAATNGGAWASYSVTSITMAVSGQPAYATVPGVGIFKSLNFGATWTLSYSSSLNWAAIGTGGAPGLSVIAAATTSGGLSTGYVVTTANGGTSWTVSTSLLSGTSVSISANALGTMFALACSNATSSAVYMSSDSAVTFASVPTPSSTSGPLLWNSVALSGSGSAIFLANTAGTVYNSTSSGASWTQILSLGTITTPISLAPNTGATELFATPGGSVSYLRVWTPTMGWGIPYTDSAMFSIAGAVNSPSFMMAGGVNNVYLSNSYGAFWYAATGLQGNNFVTVWADYTGTYLYAFTSSLFRLFTTYSGLGITYSPTAAPVPTVAPTAAPAASTLPLTMYQGTSFPDFTGEAVIATSTSGSTVIVAGSSGVYVSTTYGASFTGVSSVPVGPFSVISANGTAQVLALLGANLYMSSDMGTTWATVSVTSPTGSYFTDVTVSSAGQYVIACQSNGYVFISSNSGSTFSAASALVADRVVWSAVALSSNGKYMLAAKNGTFSVPAYYSSTYGASWTAISKTTAPFTLVYDCYVSSTGQYMYLVGDVGLYQSVNFGVTWTSVSSTFTSLYQYNYRSYTAFAPAQANRLYMVAVFGTNTLSVSGNGGSYWYFPTMVDADDNLALDGWSAVAVNAAGTLMYAYNQASNSLYCTSSAIQIAYPTQVPTAKPSSVPSVAPTQGPTAVPTAAPSPTPSSSPSLGPTASPTFAPSATPTLEPTSGPTELPSASPTLVPTDGPTAVPSIGPTASPTNVPTATPTVPPTKVPTATPTVPPSKGPTATPTVPRPTASPTIGTTKTPTALPTARRPTASPTARRPTASPMCKNCASFSAYQTLTGVDTTTWNSSPSIALSFRQAVAASTGNSAITYADVDITGISDVSTRRKLRTIAENVEPLSTTAKVAVAYEVTTTEANEDDSSITSTLAANVNSGTFTSYLQSYGAANGDSTLSSGTVSAAADSITFTTSAPTPAPTSKTASSSGSMSTTTIIAIVVPVVVFIAAVVLAMAYCFRRRHAAVSYEVAPPPTER